MNHPEKELQPNWNYRGTAQPRGKPWP